ncbi:MAG: hypothetical protein KC561_10415 [Myxococcales bacterium]|nr:hypothetical protein [Myxococcales bacterium]
MQKTLLGADQKRPSRDPLGMATLALASGILLVLLVSCSSVFYAEPMDGPIAHIRLGSTCVERASFHARINGVRTETYGCNQVAEWAVVPGNIDFTVQVEQASYRVDPLHFPLDLAEGECASLLLRQSTHFELALVSVSACSD